MQKGKDLLNQKLSGMRNKQVDQNKQQSHDELLKQLADQKDDAPDFQKIAEELQKRHEEEKRSLNTGYIKDTIYIEENLYKAFNALCTERGMKKQYVNQALSEFVQKKYREIQKNNR